MLKNFLKSALPHLIAVIVFAIVAIVYCKPALEGKVLQQSDITQFKGMAQDALQYREQYGHTPLWTNSMFGGFVQYKGFMNDLMKITLICSHVELFCLFLVT